MPYTPEQEAVLNHAAERFFDVYRQELNSTKHFNRGHSFNDPDFVRIDKALMEWGMNVSESSRPTNEEKEALRVYRGARDSWQRRKEEALKAIE